MKKVRLLAVALVFAATAASSQATIVFEGFAPAGGGTNINPTSPYNEAGYTLTPSDKNSAVFDAALSGFPGDTTSWFGFAADNTITLTGPASFTLLSALIGPNFDGSGTIDFTITGNLFGGGTESVTFDNLTTATDEQINFAGLQSAIFTTTSDAGIDNIELSSAPEPGTIFLMITGLAALGVCLRFRRAGA